MWVRSRFYWTICPRDERGRGFFAGKAPEILRRRTTKALNWGYYKNDEIYVVSGGMLITGSFINHEPRSLNKAPCRLSSEVFLTGNNPRSHRRYFAMVYWSLVNSFFDASWYHVHCMVPSRFVANRWPKFCKRAASSYNNWYKSVTKSNEIRHGQV